MEELRKKHARVGRPSPNADYAREVGMCGKTVFLSRKIKRMGGADRLRNLDESARGVLLNVLRNRKNAKPKS